MKEGERFDKGTLVKNGGEDKENRAEEGIERMHARIRLKGNGREVAREIAGYGGRERVRMKVTKRERNINNWGERGGDRAHEMKTAEEGGRENGIT